METKQKILIAGDYEYYIYEKAVIESLERIADFDIINFKFKNYLSNAFGKIERHFVIIGLCSLLMNLMLLRKILVNKPTVTFIWRGVLIHPWTLFLIKKLSSTKLVSYNNDDPFSVYYKKNIQKEPLKNRINKNRLWGYFIRGIKHFDYNFVYRDKNIEEYKTAGAKHVVLFMPYYIPSQIPQQEQKKIYDVVFIGHYENDGRAECIEKLIEAGVGVRIYGSGWSGKLKLYSHKIFPIYEEEYYKAISQSKIALIFMSKINRDEYTRRCFEIPACGVMMLSEKTPALTKIYEENKEIVFFESTTEIVEKAKFYLQEERYKLVGENGKKRAIKSGYDIDSRVLNLIRELEK